MALTNVDQFVLQWIGGASIAAFALFGWDKWRAGRPGGRRVAESTLWQACALGGWPGGLVAIWIFRHKSTKRAFQLKFAAAFLVWAALVAGALKLGGRW